MTGEKMRKNNVARVTGVIGLALSLSACGGNGFISQTRDAGEDALERSAAAVDSIQERPGLRNGGVQVSDGVFMAAAEERANATALLPSRVQAPGAVTLQSRDDLGLPQIAERLTKITGIKHVASLGASSSQEEGEGDGAATGSATKAAQATIRPEYRGRLSEVLNEISRRFNVEWTYEDEQVVFRDYVTRQYQVSSIPSATSGGSSFGGSSSSYSTDFWSEIEASLDSITGDDVVISVGRSTGLITVTAPLSNQTEIKNYIEEVNGNLSQQIAFDVNVLTVSLDRSQGFGLDLETAFSDDGNAFINNFSATGNGSLSETTGTVNIGIIDGGVSVQAAIQALRRQGSVTVDTRTGVTTTNNRPVPVEVIDSIAFISGSTIETQDNGNSIVVPQPETQETGFELQIYPRIMNSSEIMVEYSVVLSELQNIQTFGSGAQIVQLPEVSSTSFNQQAILQNGQTLVMAGFERTRTRMGESEGLTGFFAGGGTRDANREKVATVIMISPRLLRGRRAITTGQ